MKFKVGDRVKCPWGDGIVGRVDSNCDRDPPLQYYVAHGLGAGWHEESELTQVQPEPQEPVPGKFYRTREGCKALYIGRSSNGSYVYEYDGYLRQHQLPYQFRAEAGYTCMADIVGEWVDVLPTVEIKQWVVVDNQSKSRGIVWSVHDSRENAERSITSHEKPTDYFEIVELTGVLPERKASE